MAAINEMMHTTVMSSMSVNALRRSDASPPSRRPTARFYTQFGRNSSASGFPDKSPTIDVQRPLPRNSLIESMIASRFGIRDTVTRSSPAKFSFRSLKN